MVEALFNDLYLVTTHQAWLLCKVVKYVDFLQKNTAYWGFKINTSQYAAIRSILGVVKYVQQYA